MAKAWQWGLRGALVIAGAVVTALAGIGAATVGLIHPGGKDRRRILLERYKENTITQEELEEFFGLLIEDIEYAEWERKDARALKRLAKGILSELILREFSTHTL